MIQNITTPSTPSTPSRTGSAMPVRTPSRTPSPPLGGGLRDGVGAAVGVGGQNPVYRDGVADRLTPYARQCLDEARAALKRPADRRTV